MHGTIERIEIHPNPIEIESRIAIIETKQNRNLGDFSEGKKKEKKKKNKKERRGENKKERIT